MKVSKFNISNFKNGKLPYFKWKSILMFNNLNSMRSKSLITASRLPWRIGRWHRRLPSGAVAFFSFSSSSSTYQFAIPSTAMTTTATISSGKSAIHCPSPPISPDSQFFSFSYLPIYVPFLGFLRAPTHPRSKKHTTSSPSNSTFTSSI